MSNTCYLKTTQVFFTYRYISRLWVREKQTGIKEKSEEEQGKELSNPIVSFKVYSILQRNAGANLLAGQVQFNYGIVSSTSALLKKVTGKIVKLQKYKAILVYKWGGGSVVFVAEVS